MGKGKERRREDRIEIRRNGKGRCDERRRRKKKRD